VLLGDVENHIKELKLELKADHLSCHRFPANQFRLLLHTAAYCLFWLQRHHLQGAKMTTVQVNTLRLKLLKIVAGIRGDQPPHLGAPGLGLSLPRPSGPGVAKSAGQSRLISRSQLFRLNPWGQVRPKSTLIHPQQGLLPGNITSRLFPPSLSPTC
jgi:hypothetical protein